MVSRKNLSKKDRDQIRADVEAEIIRESDPTKCSCGDVRCCEKTGHARSQCVRPPVERLWHARWEYFCAVCRQFAFGGSRWDTTTMGVTGSRDETLVALKRELMRLVAVS